MAGTKKMERMIKQAMDELGLEIMSIEKTPHLKYRIRFNGQERVFVASCSSSDRNVEKAQRKTLQKLREEMAA